MMNIGLDGAFAFKTLLAPRSAIELAGITDDRANGAMVQTVTREAQASAVGRARLVLAATLAGIPAWVPEVPGESPERTRERQVEALVKAFPMGIFLPRSEQEQRAGVGYSWNTGVDYAALLRRSGREDFVRAAYAAADLDLGTDLERLAKAPRVPARSAARAYMTAHYAPTLRPSVPLLAVQNLGDLVTSPSLQESYAAQAPAADFKSLYLDQAGHCTFSGDQILDAIHTVEKRLRSERWGVPAGSYATRRPPPMPRGLD